jgi:hypothetical protein
MRYALLTVAISIGLASPAAAQQALKLSFQDGLVTVDANGIPVRAILTEWGKVGGTKIVGTEKLTGAPLTLKLVNVSEAKALETILRGAAGYMAAPRAAGSPGPSIYDRILVMASSSAPTPAAAAASRPVPGNNNAFNGMPRFAAPRREDQDEQDEPDDNPPNPPVFTFPQPGMINGAPQQLNGQPANTTGTPQSITINPAQPGTSPAGAATPGVIVAPPQPPQQQQPQLPQGMIRPPGSGR